jgi:hypothetical protein
VAAALTLGQQDEVLAGGLGRVEPGVVSGSSAANSSPP